MLKSQHFILLVMLIIIVVTIFTFILTYSLLPPKEQIPHRSRAVMTGPGIDCRPGFVSSFLSAPWNAESIFVSVFSF
ncbi:MAG: hypothetical protein GX989_04660 [Firmicutes bacterium]|nr:hypothetical protein [Bacillota bacterium]